MLKAIIKNPARRRGLLALCFAGVATVAAGAPAVGVADGGYGERELLGTRFRTSERVTYVRVAPNGEKRASIERRLGRPLPRRDYTFYVATTGERIDGYALFDDERGQHELITFGTFFDAQGRITDVEVLAYREPYGDGIRSERFRRQFVGRGAQSGFRPDDDIDAVSGATISSRAMCIGVKRASVILEEMLLTGRTMLAAR